MGSRRKDPVGLNSIAAPKEVSLIGNFLWSCIRLELPLNAPSVVNLSHGDGAVRMRNS